MPGLILSTDRLMNGPLPQDAASPTLSLSAALSQQGAEFLRVPSTTPTASFVVATFFTASASQLCRDFAARAHSLSPALASALLPIELVPQGEEVFYLMIELKMRAVVLLLSLLGRTPAVIIDCDMVLFRPHSIERLLQLCAGRPSNFSAATPLAPPRPRLSIDALHNIWQEETMTSASC